MAHPIKDACCLNFRQAIVGAFVFDKGIAYSCKLKIYLSVIEHNSDGMDCNIK